MAVQLITYDLRKPGQDYSGLFNDIRSVGAWWHHLESVWLVETALTSAQVRDLLYPHLDANDALMVVELKGDWATLGLHQASNWLRNNLAA